MKINKRESLIERYIEQKELNILVANIYNSYLEEYRYDVNKNTVERYKGTSSPVYFAFLDALEIDSDDYEFNRLAKNYELNKFEKLDTREYSNNDYYKNIHIQPKKFKKRTLDYAKYKPFECFLFDEIKIHDKKFFKETYKFGYFEEGFEYIEVKENDTTWMSITPHEINTMQKDIAKVEGNVLVLGLGLGYFSYMISNNHDVQKVTIVERDPDVIELFKLELLPQMKNREKIEIINADAFEALKSINNKFDYVYCDLYHNEQDGLPLYIKTKAFEVLNPNTKFLYWIEKSILALLRRYTLLVLEENINGFTAKDYMKAKTTEDKIVNQIYKLLENKYYSSKEQIDDLLSDDNIRFIATQIKL